MQFRANLNLEGSITSISLNYGDNNAHKQKFWHWKRNPRGLIQQKFLNHTAINQDN